MGQGGGRHWKFFVLALTRVSAGCHQNLCRDLNLCVQLAKIEARKKRTARSGIRRVSSKDKDEDAKLKARSEEVHARRPARAQENGGKDDGSAGAPLNEVWAAGRRESRDAKIDSEIAEARRQMMALGFSKHEVQSAIRSYNLKK